MNDKLQVNMLMVLHTYCWLHFWSMSCQFQSSHYHSFSIYHLQVQWVEVSGSIVFSLSIVCWIYIVNSGGQIWRSKDITEPVPTTSTAFIHPWSSPWNTARCRYTSSTCSSQSKTQVKLKQPSSTSPQPKHHLTGKEPPSKEDDRKHSLQAILSSKNKL